MNYSVCRRRSIAGLIDIRTDFLAEVDSFLRPRKPNFNFAHLLACAGVPSKSCRIGGQDASSWRVVIVPKLMFTLLAWIDSRRRAMQGSGDFVCPLDYPCSSVA